MKLECGHLSDTGISRDHNEDSIGVFQPLNQEQRRRLSDLFLVADGMGGHAGGEVASRYAVERVIQLYAAAQAATVPETVQQAIMQASAELYVQNTQRAQTKQQQMGTTLVGAVVDEDELHVFNVGDSRAYLLRDGILHQISQDHSWVAEQVRARVITKEQAHSHEQRNVITRALGQKPEVVVDYFHEHLRAGDIIILCTDGLTGPVTDAEIKQKVLEAPPQEAVQRLVDLANARGGSDNVSVLVVRVEAKTRATKQSMVRWLKWLGIIGLVAGILLGGGLLIYGGLPLVGVDPFNPRTPLAPRAAPGTLGEDVKREYWYFEGTVVSVDKSAAETRLQVRVGKDEYRVFCAPGGIQEERFAPRRGNVVAVLGKRESETSLRAALVKVSSWRWGWTLETWYTQLPPEPFWVYGVVDTYAFGLPSSTYKSLRELDSEYVAGRVNSELQFIGPVYYWNGTRYIELR